MKKLFQVLLMAALLVTGLAQASWEEASKVIDDTSRNMLALIAKNQVQGDERLDWLVGEVDLLLHEVVDFDYISRAVMGKYYRQASDAQRSQFSDVFKATLLKTYAKGIDSFKITRYELVPPHGESPEADKQIVAVNVYDNQGTRYTVQYFMLQRDGKWELTNVNLDGLNLRQTFKNQFAELVQQANGNIGKAIEAWKNHLESKVATSA